MALSTWVLFSMLFGVSGPVTSSPFMVAGRERDLKSRSCQCCQIAGQCQVSVCFRECCPLQYIWRGVVVKLAHAVGGEAR